MTNNSDRDAMQVREVTITDVAIVIGKAVCARGLTADQVMAGWLDAAKALAALGTIRIVEE